MNKAYQLLIFDWDGTLMDSTYKIVYSVQAAARAMQLEAPETKQAQQIIGLSLLPAMEYLFPEQKKTVHEQLVEQYKRHYVNENRIEQSLFAGVLPAFIAFEKTGIMMAVATGKSRRGLDRVFTQVPLAPYFAVTRCADEARSKPNPKMLYDILAYTQIDANKALMIGDTTFDMDMAEYAGIDAVAVNYGAHSCEQLQKTCALAIMESFTELSSWLLDGRLESAFTQE